MKKQKKQKKFNAAWILLLILLLFTIELLFYTWCRVQSIRMNYRIAAELKKQTFLISNQNKLKIELERLKSPDRIARIAREKLGLHPPLSEQVIILP